MKRILLSLALACAGTSALAQQATRVQIINGTTIVSTSNPLPVSAVITPSGTQDVNLTKVGGSAIAIGQALMAASLPVVIASNQSALTVTGSGGTFPVTQSTSPWIVAGGGTAGTAATGVVTIQGIASMTPILVSLNTTPSIANGNGIVIAPTSVATAGIVPVVSSVAESGHVLKGSAGNLYGLTVSIGASSGYVLLFNATSAPGDGGVTPVWCFPVTSNGTNGGVGVSWLPGPPLNFTTGITAVFSTTGCFTKTASATATFSGMIQ